jgi:hypothetical protein
MKEEPEAVRKVRYIDFDGGRDYRSWLTKNFPSKSDQPPVADEAEDTPDANTGTSR